MQDNRKGREGYLSKSHHLLFFLHLFFWYFYIVFPASAFLNGTETLITTDTYKTFTYPPAIYGDWIAWSTQDIDDPASGMSSRYIIVTNLKSGDQYVIPSPLMEFCTFP